MNRVDIWRYRWHLARTIQRRDLQAAIYGIGLYAILSAAIAIAAALLRSHVTAVQDSGLLVLSSPFVTPLFSAAILSSIYLAVTSAATMCRERNQGPLEGLSHSPVDRFAYLLGKYLAQMCLYSLMVASYLSAFALYALFTNLAFDLNLLLATLLSAATTSAVVTAGILLSTLTRSARNALLMLLVATVALLGVQLGDGYVSTLTNELARGHHTLLCSVQTAFTWLHRAVRWLSPFAHLERGIAALLQGSSAEYLLMIGLSLFYTIIAFGLAVRTLHRKGVH